MKSIKIVFLTVLCALWWSSGAFTQPVYGQLSAADEMTATTSLRDALEYNQTGVTSTWRNPDTQNSGASQPLKTFQTTDGSYCREFLQTVTIAGRQVDAYQTACRQADGNWKIVNFNPPASNPPQKMVTQSVNRMNHAATYGARRDPGWYPGYLLLGFSFYTDDHHRAGYHFRKYRSHSYWDRYPYRGNERSHRWGRNHEWSDDSRWDDHRSRGRGGDGRQRSRDDR